MRGIKAIQMARLVCENGQSDVGGEKRVCKLSNKNADCAQVT